MMNSKSAPATAAGLGSRRQLFDNSIRRTQQPEPQVLANPLGQVHHHRPRSATLDFEVRFEMSRECLAVKPGNGQ